MIAFRIWRHHLFRRLSGLIVAFETSVWRAPFRGKRGAYRLGLFSEYWVSWILRLKGYRILAHRFRTPAGEVDLVAFRRRELVLVEVKARKRLEDGLYALEPYQRKRLLRATSFVCATFPRFSSHTIRFDLVVQRPWRFPSFIKNIQL